MTAPAPAQHPAHAHATSAPHLRAAPFTRTRTRSPLGHAALTGSGSPHPYRPLTGDPHAREEGGMSLEVSCSLIASAQEAAGMLLFGVHVWRAAVSALGKQAACWLASGSWPAQCAGCS